MGSIVRKAAVVLLAAVGLAAAVGLLTGSVALVTTHGISMAPRIAADDLVVVRRASYEVGDVVAYRSPELRQLVLHRIIAQDGPHYHFQGDNNDFIDPEVLTQDDIIGQELLHVPGGGRWLRLMGSGPVLGMAVLLLITSGGGAATTVQRRRRKDRRTVSDRPQPAPISASTSRLALPLWLQTVHQRVTGLPDPLPHLAMGAAAIGVAGLLLGGLSWTQPTSTDGSARTVEGVVDFSYTAQVADSEGSGATVTAPHPVFWPTAQTVDMGYRYQGEAGTVTVDADLATADGWRSTVRLAEPTRIAGGHDGTVNLVLPELWAHADAAATSRTDPLEQIDVSIVPRITLDSGGVLAAEMALTMDLLTLRFSHVGDATPMPPSASAEPAPDDPLSVQLSTSTTAPIPATLTAFGRTMKVATARAVSLAAVALAGIVAVGLALYLRGTDPVPESVRIARRYRHLLLPVLPVTSRRDACIVEVTGIEPLVKLAETYGVPILHWSRSGVDTYLVEDDETIYRYRTGAAAPPMPHPTITPSWTINLTAGLDGVHHPAQRIPGACSSVFPNDDVHVAAS